MNTKLEWGKYEKLHWKTTRNQEITKTCFASTALKRDRRKISEITFKHVLYCTYCIKFYSKGKPGIVVQYLYERRDGALQANVSAFRAQLMIWSQPHDVGIILWILQKHSFCPKICCRTTRERHFSIFKCVLKKRITENIQVSLTVSHFAFYQKRLRHLFHNLVRFVQSLPPKLAISKHDTVSALFRKIIAFYQTTSLRSLQHVSVVSEPNFKFSVR